MRKRWVYRTDETGHCRAIPCDVIPTRYGETLDSLERRVVRDLYAMECRQDPGLKRLEAEFGGLLKKVWVDNVERDAAFDRRREQALRTQRERLAYD